MRGAQRMRGYGAIEAGQRCRPVEPAPANESAVQQTGSASRRKAAAAVCAALVFSLLVAGSYRETTSAALTQLEADTARKEVTAATTGGDRASPQLTLTELSEPLPASGPEDAIVSERDTGDDAQADGGAQSNVWRPRKKVRTPVPDWGVGIPRAVNSRGSLTVVATNEYGSYSKQALALYAFAAVVEPHRSTTLTALCEGSPCAGAVRWLITEADVEGPKEGVTPIVDTEGSAVLQVLLEEPGTFYYVRAEATASQTSSVERRVGVAADRALAAPVGEEEEVKEANDVWFWESARVACKYVRRELRELNADDREAFLSALETMYRLPLAEGRRMYGERYISHAALSAMHNSNAYCYHNGMQFLTSHTAFDMVVERSLQAINKRVALHYWDFMVEAGQLGSEWPESEIFSNDWFGDAIGTVSAGFQILDGRFAAVRQAWDPKYELVSEDFKTQHNAYGYVDSKTNSQTGPFVTRTHSFCGVKGNASFVGCDIMISCFDEMAELSDWVTCVERTVHMNMHGLLGGAWECATDFESWRADYPEIGTSLLTFVLEYIAANRWGPNNYAGFSDNNVCPEADACLGLSNPTDTFSAATAEVVGAAAAAVAGGTAAAGAGYTPSAAAGALDATQACICSCKIDVDALSDDEVHDLMFDLLQAMSKQNETFVLNDPADQGSLVLASDGVPLHPRANKALLRELVRMGCTPGRVGLMATGASPLDPIFWTLHPLYEKAIHPLRLTKRWREQYAYDWVDGTCKGSAVGDELPFTEKMLGLGEGERHLTNLDIMRLADPTQAALAYTYDRFSTWGTCSWSPT